MDAGAKARRRRHRGAAFPARGAGVDQSGIARPTNTSPSTELEIYLDPDDQPMELGDGGNPKPGAEDPKDAEAFPGT